MTTPSLLRDDHCHTIYSGHSPADSLVVNMVGTAAERGLDHVVILEHLPTLPPGITLRQWREARNDRHHLNTIGQEIEGLRDEYPQLEILRGIEIDADPWTLDGALMLEDFTGIDVVVASTHVFPGGDAFWFEPIRVVDPDVRRHLTRQWFDWEERIVESGRVDVLAHPGCLIAARELIDSFADPEVLEGFARLAERMAARGVAFELNEALYHKIPQACRATYAEVVRTVRRSGVRFTVGTDSHSPRRIGQYVWVLELMNGARIGPDELAPLARGKRGTEIGAGKVEDEADTRAKGAAPQ